MHRRLRPVLAAALLAAAVPAVAAGMSSNATVDNGRHPSVGAIFVERDGALEQSCSGTLVAPRVVLTATHCTSFWVATTGPRVWVSFDQAPGDTLPLPVPPSFLPGTADVNPAWRPPSLNNDVSVVVLDSPVPASRITPSRIAGPGAVAALPKGSLLTVAGYGTEQMQPVKGVGATFPRTGERRYGVMGARTIAGEFLKLSQLAVKGFQGACFGDSGGPGFIGAGTGETGVIAGVTSSGDAACAATNDLSRVDTPAAQAYLAGFGVRPG